MSSEIIPEPVSQKLKLNHGQEIVPETKPESTLAAFSSLGVPRTFYYRPCDSDFPFCGDRTPHDDRLGRSLVCRRCPVHFSGTGKLRPEHPPLAKLFIIAGDYIFNGFKTPEYNIGATNLKNIYNSKTVNLIIVSDTSKFKAGMTIRIDAEQMNVIAVDTSSRPGRVR